MDERLEKALKYANYKVTLSNQKENLKTELYEKLVIGINGGLFNITPELISFAAMLSEKTDSAVMIDKNNNPVLIEDLSDFVDEIISRYIEATNFYHQEYEKLRKARSVSKLIDFNEEKIIKDATNE